MEVCLENWCYLDGIEEARCTDDHARGKLGDLKARGPRKSSGECSICVREGGVTRRAHPREGSARLPGEAGESDQLLQRMPPRSHGSESTKKLMGLAKLVVTSDLD